ncbi:S8 family serine peptidase [Alteribacter natronophilus]|uniref:S8 family serine peptidase n=1 Tax=Alteribacter natronophilus TaxID=2583810 RepID=UPI00110D8B12|nr:S8 family serine peptidase [Alteribacter natronophilus]TMW72161.1 peptidase S8 [Alteribacter natronophilus]
MKTHVWRVAASIIIFTLLLPASVLAVDSSDIFPMRPPLPQGDPDERQVIIVEAEGDTAQAMARVQEQLPDAEIRRTFMTLYNGFSLEISQRDLEHLQSIEGIRRIDPVAMYEVSMDESVPFIGGRDAGRMHDERGDDLTGKGVKVGVIDTGIDYSHPDLRDSYKGGYDVVDEDNDPMETQKDQGAPTMHGTHVAGIIGANGRLKGVAPEAEIYGYRALGPTGMGTTEQVIAAIEKAVEDGVDVINLSLGNTVNGPDWPTSVALDKAVEEGVVAVTSNGNSGPNLWTVGSPGTSSRAISVGASTPPLKVPYLTFDENRGEEWSVIPMQRAKPWNLKRDRPIVYAGLGRKEDFKSTDVKGKIALVERGIVTFTVKAKAALEAGAAGLIVYNNQEGEYAGALEEALDLPVVSMSKEDGEAIREQLSKTAHPFIRTIYREEEDFMAPFSSRGPVTYSWDVKPDLVAPGVAIDSTVPKGYLDMNGTSMAAPHIAGAAALILQKYPDWTPDQLKAALMNTAKPLVDRDGELEPPHVQGTGRVDLAKALNAETLVYPGAVSFGKWLRNDRRIEKTVHITVDNQSNKRKRYTIDPPFDVPDGIQWKVPFSFYLNPGEKREVPVIMDILPAVFDGGMYSGMIEVKSGSESVNVPYLFFVEEPDYPRVMAFMLEQTAEENVYQYEVYLPGGAEEFGIVLYDPDTFEFIDYIEAKTDVERGMLEEKIEIGGLPSGIYKALIFAKQDGKEDTIERDLFLGQIVTETSP